MGLVDKKERRLGNSRSGQAVGPAKHDYAEVVENVKEDIAALVDEVEAQHGGFLEDALAQCRKVRAANERHGDDETDDSARAGPLQGLLYEQRVNVNVTVGNDRVIPHPQRARWPEDASVWRITDDGVIERIGTVQFQRVGAFDQAIEFNAG